MNARVVKQSCEKENPLGEKETPLSEKASKLAKKWILLAKKKYTVSSCCILGDKVGVDSEEWQIRN